MACLLSSSRWQTVNNVQIDPQTTEILLKELFITLQCLAVSAISSLYVVRFGLSLRFCHLEFDMEFIADSCKNEKADNG